MAMQNEHLKTLRLKKGYTQQEVADKIGVTKATISKYEKGLRGINHIEELAELFGVDPAYIYFGETLSNMQSEIAKQAQKADEEIRQYWESVLLTDAVIDLIPLLDQLNEEGQQKAIERVEELTEIPKYQRQDTPEDKE